MWWRRRKTSPVLGRGTFGVVRADVGPDGTSLAVKTVPWSSAATEEVRLLRALPPHPHLVQYLSSRKRGRTLTITMGRVGDGRTLADHRDLTGPSVRLATAHVASALAHVHARGILHRDVKARNVLVVDANLPTMRCVLGDFGVATGATDTRGHYRLPNTTGGRGDTRYRAPEALHGRPYGPAADLFSLGLVLWEMLSRLSVGEVVTGPWCTDVDFRECVHQVAEDAADPVLALLLVSLTRDEPGERPTAVDVAQSLRHGRRPSRTA